jgi:hypothetical protein
VDFLAVSVRNFGVFEWYFIMFCFDIVGEGGGDIFLDISGFLLHFLNCNAKNILWDLEAFGLKMFFLFHEK